MKSTNLDMLASLLAGSTDWLSAGELALQLRTTTRTVRNYIRELNESAAIPLVISGVRGYRWNTALNSLRVMYQIARKQPETPRERELYILRKLIFKSSAGIGELAAELSVSERTVETDLDAVRRRVRQFQLRLRQRQDRVALSGAETDIRRLCFYCITRTCKAQLLTLELVSDIYPGWDTADTDSILTDILTRHQLTVNAYCRGELLLRLILQAYRLRQGFCLQPGELSQEETVGTPDYSAAWELTAFLAKKYDVSYSPEEVRYTALLLLCKADYAGKTAFLNGTCWQEMPELALQVLDVLRRRAGVQFPTDTALTGLIHYFHRLILRCRWGLPTYNPLAESVRHQLPFLHNCAAWMLTPFLEHYHIRPSKSEVAFLTMKLSRLFAGNMHIEPPVQYTLVCPDFDGSSARMAAAIRQQFGSRLQLAHLVDTLQVKDIPQSELCLSVVPIENQKHLVTVSPFLTDGDWGAIHREVMKLRRSRQRDFLTAYLTCYAHPAHFECGHNFHSKEEAIGYMCGKLQEYGAVDESFLSSVLLRETADSTVYFDLVALPHTCLFSVKKNSLYILLNREGIPWDDRSVKLVVLMALERDLMEDYKQLLELFIKLFSRPKNISAVLAARDLPAFIDTLSRLNTE